MMFSPYVSNQSLFMKYFKTLKPVCFSNGLIFKRVFTNLFCLGVSYQKKDTNTAQGQCQTEI